MTGQEILDEVRYLINDTQYSRYTEINRAFRRILRITNFNFLKETIENWIPIVANQAEYTVDMSGIRRLERIWVYGTDSGEVHWHQLQEANSQLFEEKKASVTQPDGSIRTDRPGWFKIEGNRITLSPTPDTTYTTRIDIIRDVPEVKRDEEPCIPSAYHDLIAELAAGYILEAKGDEASLLRSQVLIARATEDFTDLVADVHPNRTLNIDRTAVTWIK